MEGDNLWNVQAAFIFFFLHIMKIEGKKIIYCRFEMTRLTLYFGVNYPFKYIFLFSIWQLSGEVLCTATNNIPNVCLFVKSRLLHIFLIISQIVVFFWYL